MPDLPDDPRPEYRTPPDWWHIGPLVEFMDCDCGHLLIRYWFAGAFYCPVCGVEW